MLSWFLIAASLGAGAVGAAPAPGPLPPLPKGLTHAPWEDLYVPDCQARLREEAGDPRVVFLPSKRVRKERKRGYEPLYCHVPQRMRWVRGPGKIRYTGYLLVNCHMALRLARFERVVQEVAQEVFGPGHTVSVIHDYGTYNCRRLRTHPEVFSQHSYGNAIDIGSFYVRGYGTVSVKKHWRRTRKVRAKRFLHTLSARLKAEHVFTNVLDPDYNRGHGNHFHLDAQVWPALEPGEPSAARSPSDAARPAGPPKDAPPAQPTGAPERPAPATAASGPTASKGAEHAQP